MSDVFEQIKAELKDHTPIFDNLTNSLRPLVQSSEIVGGLKALMALYDRIEKHAQTHKTINAADILTFIDQVREETVRNRRG